MAKAGRFAGTVACVLLGAGFAAAGDGGSPSGADWAHAACDGAGAALWLQAAALFPYGVLDVYRDESDGHFARTVAGLAIQPIRIGAESILELAAWRRYRGQRTVHALIAYAPAFSAWRTRAGTAALPRGARAWAEGKSAPLAGFETRAPVGPWYHSHSRFLFASRAAFGTQSDLAFRFGQGFSRPVDLGGGMRLWPQLSLEAAWMDAWKGPDDNDYDHLHATAFLAGAGSGWEWRKGIFDLRLDYALEAGPILREHRFSRPGAGAGMAFRDGWTAGHRLAAGAGLTF